MKGFNYLRHLLIATVFSAAALTGAHAEDALTMELTANKVSINAEGNKVYSPISNAPKGTVVQYKATYTNNIDQDINNLAVTLPVPNNMTLTGGIFPASGQATIDGKTFADMPLMRKVNGKMVKVPLSEYRAVRWNIKLLPAQKSADVSLNAIVN